MSEIPTGLEGLIDDILVSGRDMEEHNTRLTAALQCIQAAGATLNLEKCEFAKSKLLFLSHHIDKDGIQADPAKTAAITEM